MLRTLLLFATLLASSWAKGSSYIQPQQIHIAYGEQPSEMYVVWTTFNDTTPVVSYQVAGSPKTLMAPGVTRQFKDGGSLHRVQYIHRAKLTGLIPGKKYQYRCGQKGSTEAWSDPFGFTAMPSGSDWSPRLAVYGDLGYVNPQSLDRLVRETHLGMYDAVLHVGDFAYEMETDNARRGDAFMMQIQPIAANIPYMTCPGNHEVYGNFTNYRHRFVMPTDELSDNMFFSFNMGPAHIISFSTEYYYFLNLGREQAFRQYRWLEKDLIEATKPENRAKRPWIITMGHRPMYCSNNNKNDCTNNESTVRVGSSDFPNLGLENLFYDYGVDLQLWAHEHSYERLWPIYDRMVYNGTQAPYTNPGAPVHIITGSAGCYSKHDPFGPTKPSWSAFRIEDYGYTRMTVHNATHLYLEQVSDDKGGEVVDRIWYIRDKHGPFPHH